MPTPIRYSKFTLTVGANGGVAAMMFREQLEGIADALITRGAVVRLTEHATIDVPVDDRHPYGVRASYRRLRPRRQTAKRG